MKESTNSKGVRVKSVFRRLSKTIDKTLIYWAVATFDRTKEKPLPVETRFWFLEWNIVPANEKIEILTIMGLTRQKQDKARGKHEQGDEQYTIAFNTPDLRMLKYRKYFRLRPHFDISKAISSPDSPIKHILPVNLGIEYFEDESGKAISKIDIYQHVSGQENPIILGEPESVLRLGSAPINNAQTPTTDDSDTLALFLDVVASVAESSWYHKPISLTISKIEAKSLIQAVFPDPAETQQVVMGIRQLYASDDLFNRATNCYMRFCGDKRKVEWVTERKKAFNNFLNGNVAFSTVQGITTREFINTFLYGAGIVHSKDIAERKQQLHTLISVHGRAHLVMTFHASLHYLMGIILHVFGVIRQDFRHWLISGQCPKPTIVPIRHLLASQMEETEKD